MKDRIIKKRTKHNKLVGYIRECETYSVDSCKYSGKVYIVYDKNDDYVIGFDTYQKAYNKLYEMEV